MSSRQEKSQPLSDLDIQSIGAEIVGGAQPMVWFTPAAVGVEAGRSGKVVRLGDPSEGDFLHVKPTGSKDVLSFSPTEVTLTKPPLKRTAVPDKPADPAPALAPPAAAPAAPKPAVDKPVAAPPQAPVVEKAPRPATGARKTAKAAETTVTLTGAADGEWTVEVLSGKTRTVRGLPVTGAAVAQAAKALHPDVAEAIEAVLEAARGAQRAKVEQLQAELENARRMLDELSD